VRLWRPPPDPRLGMAIEMLGGDAGYIGNIMIIGQGLSGEGFASEDGPPPLNQIQPSGSHGDAGVLDPRMCFQLLPDRSAGPHFALWIDQNGVYG
jgi:hypothetical protein